MIEEPQKLEDSQNNEDIQKMVDSSKDDEEQVEHKGEKENTLDIKYSQAIDPKIFVNQELLNKFICPLCKGILYEPIIPCKSDFKIYCTKCIEKYLKNNDNKCPDCSKILEETPQKFDVVQASISCLDVKCKNEKVGCKWQGKYAFYNDHVLSCPKEETHCVFQGCDKIFLRENLDSHLKLCPFRVIMCDKCGINIIASELTNHRNECPREVIKCPQKCGLKFERCKLNEHNEKCPFTPIKCPFEKIGCDEVIKRSEFYKKMNENLSKHINLFLIDYLNFKEQSKNIWKQAGIEIDEDNEEAQKEKFKLLNETLNKMYAIQNHQEENKKNSTDINENKEENKIKKIALVEEEKTEDISQKNQSLNKNKYLKLKERRA